MSCRRLYFARPVVALALHTLSDMLIVQRMPDVWSTIGIVLFEVNAKYVYVVFIPLRMLNLTDTKSLVKAFWSGFGRS